MKRDLRYMLLLPLATFALMSCDPIEEDQYLIESFDHTAPAYVMFAQSLKGVCAASGSLVSALNFNEWLTAPDEESRLAVEDKYYPFRKVREEEEGVWKIYDQRSSERYSLSGGLTLNDEGAVWTVLNNPIFYDKSATHPEISRVGKDSFRVRMNGVPIDIAMQSPNNLYDYLHWWDRYYTGTNLTADLLIATNNTEFRTGKAEQLQFTIEGKGSLVEYDEDNGRYQTYTVAFEITEPLRLYFDDVSGMIVKNVIYTGALTIHNSHPSSVEAQIVPYNAIVINYHPKEEGDYVGYYDLTGNNITPR